MSTSTIKVGKPAPEFVLQDQSGRPSSLKDYAGKWVVLYFYPKDDTPGCTTEACEFTDGLKAFETLSAIVLGCSPDTPASHMKFIAKHGLKLRLLSDPEHTVLTAYGAWGEKSMYGKKYMGILRSTVVVGADGKVKAVFPKVKPEAHARQVLDALEAD
jgi:peroxiredoxin Q/BCP